MTRFLTLGRNNSYKTVDTLKCSGRDLEDIKSSSHCYYMLWYNSYRSSRRTKRFWDGFTKLETNARYLFAWRDSRLLTEREKRLDLLNPIINFGFSDRQTDRQTDMHTDRHTDTYRQTYRHWDRHVYTGMFLPLLFFVALYWNQRIAIGLK